MVIDTQPNSHVNGITNSGSLIGTGSYSVNIQSYSTVNSIVNNASGIISSAGTALSIYKHATVGSITNSGSISAGYAMLMSSHSTVSGGITNSGHITGVTDGIHVAHSSTVSGGITNSGIISGGSHGILLSTSTVSGGITNSGTISGKFGMMLTYSTLSGGLTNTGKILGSSYTGLFLHNSSIGGGITNSGTISSNSIGFAIYATTVGGNISNSGKISGAGYSGLYIGANSTVAGSVINSGTISNASSLGVRIGSNSILGGFTNSGTISSPHTAIQINSATITGGITNSGTISAGGGYDSIKVAGSLSGITIIGNNTAKFIGAVSAPSTPLTVAAGAAYTMDNGNQFTVSGFTNNGRLGVAAGGTGTITGNYSQTGTLQENVTNGTTFGTLLVSGTATLPVSNANINVMLAPSHGIAAGTTIAGIMTATGGITSGTFNVTDNSVLLDFTAASTGTIINLTAIVGTHNCGSSITTSVPGPCYIGFDLSTINVASSSGTISGGATGIKALAGSYSGSITNSGHVTGNTTGVLVSQATSISGGISNSGTIQGVTYAGIVVNKSTVGGSITNSGMIQGGASFIGAGIRLASGVVSGGITNSGTITGPSGIITSHSTISGGITNASQGSISGGSGIYIAAGSHVAGIANAGTIAGSLTGVKLYSSTISGGVNNSGTISGAGAFGIRFANGSVSGGLTNSGTISGGSIGVRLSGTSALSGGVTNSGTIAGGHYAVYVSSASALDSISITGANTANFSGDVFAQNTPVTITSGSTFTGTNAFNVQSFNIASTGVFNINNSMPGLGAINGAISNAGITASQGVTNAGTISVADGVTGHITGNYTQASTGVYQLGASSSTSYGKLAVSGTANLAGTAYVNVNSVNTLASGQTMLGVLTSTGLTGNFASVGSSSNLFTFTSVVDGNNIDLSIAAAGASGGATVVTDTKANGNNPGAGAAVVFDNLIAQGSGAPAAMAPVITALGKLTTSQEVSNAVAQTLPLHTGGETAAVTGSLHSVNHIVQSREEGQQGRSSGDGFIEDGKVWVKPFGSLADQGDYQGVSGFKALTGGIVFGADADFSSTSRIGIALATANTDVSGNSAIAPQSSNVATYQLALYGSHSLNENTDFNFQADLGDHINKGNRGIPFMGTTAQSNYHSLSEQLGAGIAYTMKLSEVSTFTPTARVDYTTVHNNGYTESGAGALDLIVDSSTVNEMIISADGKFTHNLNEGSIVTANLGVGYDVLNKQSSIVSAFAGDPTATFTTLGLNPSPWIARGGLGFVRTEKTTEVTLRYDVDASTSHFVGQTVSARFRWSF
jgi:uncharacterized protein with beta-barrel porin domain